ncbi:MAG: Beta-galactosidase III [Lentisphaerae bacterium ADurb.Bin242]|nr:MAG: Beta-galactosidase III [Lentisphaerae bacterium ADurb.Bin242]
MFYGRDNVLLYCDEFLGYFEALLNAGRIFDLIGTKHLSRDGLKKYKLIVLPGAACLSDEEVRCLREYIAGGGKILATYHTSLYDAFGGRREDFALRDVFGCSYAGHLPEKDYRLRTEYPALRRKELEYGFLKYASFDRDVAGYALPAPAVTVKNCDAEIRGSLLRSKPGLKTYCPGFVNSVTFSDREETLITTHPFGRGRATYIGAKLGALYAEAAPAFARKIMLEEIDRLIAGELDIEVRAPSSIEVTAFRQSANRIVIHLNNRQSAPDRFDLGYLLAPSLYEAQDMLPVYGIEVELSHAAGNIVKSYLAPEKIELEAKEKNGKLLFRIPEIKYHSMLVVETE